MIEIFWEIIASMLSVSENPYSTALLAKIIITAEGAGSFTKKLFENGG